MSFRQQNYSQNSQEQYYDYDDVSEPLPLQAPTTHLYVQENHYEQEIDPHSQHYHRCRALIPSYKQINYPYPNESGNFGDENRFYGYSSEYDEYESSYGQQYSKESSFKTDTYSSEKYKTNISRNGRRGAVTTNTPRYMHPLSDSKKPSARSLPVVTPIDPSLMKKKKNIKMYPAHEINSQGDVPSNSTSENLDSFLKNCVAVVESENICEFDELDVGNLQVNKIKEMSQYLKPRIPSSVKMKQDHQNLKPQMKLSLDRLLNRLQKCEDNDEAPQGPTTSKSEINEGDDKGKCIKSFNYESLSRKRQQSEEILQFEKLSGVICPERPMDEQCAVELHKSKSYIIDLIDKALSKELGTVPRDGTMEESLTPRKAIKAISRHRQSFPTELCYELTATLTDSIISKNSAPPQEDNHMVKCSSSEGMVDRHLDDGNYINQLKKLRWGHIRHIQHEARKLADLEEFLESCGELE